jgi:predicted Zn-dependent protease
MSLVRRFLRCARRPLSLALAAAVVASATVACQAVKDAVPNEGTFGRLVHGAADAGQLIADMQITAEQEKEIGRGVSAQLIATYGLSSDAALTEYVTLIGSVVASAAGDPDREYHFAVLDTTSVNAFSTPGGFVFLTKGSVLAASSEAEIAGLLGHEIAHVMAGHGIAAVKHGILVRGLSNVAQSAGQFTLDEKTMGPVVDIASDAVLKKRDRGDEIESDARGAEIAADAGYNPNGMRRFLERLADLGRRNDSSVEHLFATHPSAADRIEELDAAMAERGLERDDPRPWLEDRFRARVRRS